MRVHDDAPHGRLVSTRLENGLTVVAQEDRVLGGLRVHLRYDVGSRHEPVGLHGAAHFLEHLMFEGTPGHPDFLGELQRGGARDVNASTSQDRTAFFMTVPPALLSHALAMEADRMARLPGALDEAVLARHLALVRREEEERARGPLAEAPGRLFAEAFPPSHPYRHVSMGDTAALARLTPAQVSAFHHEHYRPERATLVVVGDLPGRTAVEAAAVSLGSVDRGPAPPPPPFVPPSACAVPPGPGRAAPSAVTPGAGRPARSGASPGPSGIGGTRWAVCPPGVPPQVYLLAHTAPYGTREHDAAAVLAAVLGQGRGSRLFRRAVRDTRVARPATDLTAAWNLEQGGSVLFGSVAAMPGTPGARLLAVVRETLASVAGGLLPGELRRAVRLVRRERLEELDDPAARAEAFAAHSALRGDPRQAYAVAGTVAGVTEEEVVRVARKCLPAATYLVYDHAARNTPEAAA
ncbi:M16 family metallopeptidase [Streptomyces sp. NPDC058052]|uniref:M16 family metallopeptidase n=1 Tax=Streptomyces sp. NPDC058052 TaxID=3346316 RepID=UPI0036EA6522